MSIWGSPVLLGGGGGAAPDCYWRVRFYTKSGTVLMNEVYAANGSDLRAEYGTDWAAAPSGEADPTLLASVRQNLSVYATWSTRLPYSAAVVCEADATLFSPDSLTWGRGNRPITFTKLGATLEEDGSVLIPVKTSNVWAYVELGTVRQPYTAYIVAKLNNAAQFSRILSSMASHSGGQGMLLYGSTITVSSWANDTSAGVSAATYFAGALKYNGSTDSGGIVNNLTYITKPPTASSSNLAIARTDVSSEAANAEPCDIQVKYLGVTLAGDDEAAMRGNLAGLMTEFGIT